ncbi:MAG: carboxylesterase family protein, partial [Candidatus Neomarinimicrobiota bacterium]
MKRILLLVWLVSILVVNVFSQEYRVPIQTSIETGENIAVAETKYGKVRGYIHDGIYIYKGIPYGKAERFLPAEQPDKWEGIRSSTMWGPTCPMMNPPELGSDEVDFIFQHDWGIPDEDCLRVNIWTPSITDNIKRPVMVWIHGGAYSYGSSQELPMYDGENLVKTGDLVYVSVNHRLNLLGFTDLSEYGEKYKSSVNIGMMDLVAALEWLRDNISNFGGDPNNVTIFGQSGGGGKVSTLMSTPYAKGLFHRAVVQSGANPQFQEQKITKRIGRALVDDLGLTNIEIDSIQIIPYEILAKSYQKATKKIREELTREDQPPVGYGFGTSPTIDGDFLPYEFADKRALEISNDVPLMIGSTKNEFIASLWGNPPMRNESIEAIEKYIDDKYGEKASKYIKAVKKAYPNDTKPTDLIDVDLMFRRGTVKHANLKSANSKAPVFMYMFIWQSPVFDGDYKAIHCMELPFVFNNIPLCKE